MELYRVLRVSIYLLVASGAFAIGVAEDSPWLLVAVFVFGLIAYFTVDSRRIQPVRMELAGAMAFALLVWTLLPLRNPEGWSKELLPAFAHFLCAIQVLLFFTAFRGPMLLAFCGSTLAVLVISGVIKQDVSLLGRLICFVSLTSWTLFIHSLWCAREAFNARNAARSPSPRPSGKETAAGITHSGETKAEPSKEVEVSHGPEARATNILSERAFWQELAMTGVISIACLLLGLFLFLAAPRLNDRLAIWIAPWKPDPKKNDPKPVIDQPVPGSGSIIGIETGASDATSVEIGDLGAIEENQSTAVTAKFDSLPAEFATDTGRILLRSQVFSVYNCADKKWIIPDVVSHSKDPSVDILDPTVPDKVLTPRPEVKQIIRHLDGSPTKVFMAVGTIRTINTKLVDQDSEGALTASEKDHLDQAELRTQAFFHDRDLPANARAEHPDVQRYVRQLCVTSGAEQSLRNKALSITEHYSTPLKKIRAIISYLQNPKNCGYTLKLNEIHPARDPVERFLLHPDARERRGHCGYFATAFVALCRLSGIPARLAKGYTCDYPANNGEPVELRFKNANAHCWGEVYFKGYGWVPFDPTPSEPSPEEVTSAKTPAPLPEIKSDNKPPTGPTEGFVESTWNKFIHFTTVDQRRAYQAAISLIKSKAEDAGEVLIGGSNTGWIGAALAWLGVTAALAWLFHIYRKRGGSRTAIANYGTRRARAAVAFYNDLLQVLSRRGFQRRPGQTPREFADYVVKRGGNAFSPVLTVTEIFETVRYGDVEISQEDFNSLQKSLDSLRELTFVLTPQGSK
jgi:hypothetical protein